ncbi:MAG: hypothetical protein H6741_33980 [Alphaproteobacteria bacterium]|nr:hypothetical protein [Alphaproteobacteria bacterium]MCB9797728.1 hypothetical protein [Alphaproteobacteria bacterium]
MFRLDDAIKARVDAALPEGCAREDQRAELEDHLHSEVEQLMAQGMSPQDAFADAARRLGAPEALKAQLSHHRSLWGRICAFDRRISGGSGGAQRLQVGNGILWAAAILATALVVRDAEVTATLLTVVMVPLWFASTLVVRGAVRRV